MRDKTMRYMWNTSGWGQTFKAVDKRRKRASEKTQEGKKTFEIKQEKTGYK